MKESGLGDIAVLRFGKPWWRMKGLNRYLGEESSIEGRWCETGEVLIVTRFCACPAVMSMAKC